MKTRIIAPVDPWLIRLENWLWQTENARSHWFTKAVWHGARVLFAVVRDLFAGNITLHAMGLVYTTLLSIVPFLALSFSLLKAFGIHNQLEPILNTWTAALGERGPEIVESIINFVDNFNVGVLSSVGLGLLIYTVISLVQKVEHSFNEVWRVSELRSLAQRFSNYLSVIIVGPLLVFSAMGATAAIVGSDFVTTLITIEPFGWMYSLLTRLTPYLMIIALFTFLYVFIPNTKVSFKHGLIGGIIAGILWQSLSVAFAKFVAFSTSHGSYAAIYSGFAIGIISLWWIYLSWLVLLAGAAVSFYSQHAQQITRFRKEVGSAEVDELTGLTMIYRVARDFDIHGGGIDTSDMESNLSFGPQVISRIREKLIKHNILVAAGEGSCKLVPARPLDKITMREILIAIRQTEAPLPLSLKNETAVIELAESLHLAMEAQLDAMTLADWVRMQPEQPTEAD